MNIWHRFQRGRAPKRSLAQGAVAALRASRSASLTASLATSLLLAGCALSGHAPAPAVATYVLGDAAAALPAETALNNLVLKVSMPRAAPAYTSTRIAYIEQQYRVDYFALNEWADPPAQMLRTLLTTQLTQTGLFRYVVADAPGVDETFRLDSDIIELVQVFSESASEVRLSIRFDLVDVARRAIVVSDTISVSEAAARDPYAGVVAANRAVQRVLAQLTMLLHDPVAALAQRTAATH